MNKKKFELILDEDDFPSGKIPDTNITVFGGIIDTNPLLCIGLTINKDGKDIFFEYSDLGLFSEDEEQVTITGHLDSSEQSYNVDIFFEKKLYNIIQFKLNEDNQTIHACVFDNVGEVVIDYGDISYS